MSPPPADLAAEVSGGERQRLVMARMLLRKPRILLLDEATSALDNDTERKLCAELDAMVRENRGTRVVIAHRLSTIQNADRILVMGNGSDDSGGAACKGNVCESGTHAELLARPGGKYAQLWNAAASASDATPAEAAKPAAAAPDRVAPKAADGAELYSIAVPSHLSSHFASELNALARRLGCSSTDPSHDARRIVLTPIEASGHLSFRTAASAVMRTTSLHRTAAEADAAGDESDRAGDHEDLPPLIALQLERAATMN